MRLLDKSFTVTTVPKAASRSSTYSNDRRPGDPSTHSLTIDADATRTDAACAFQTRDGVLTVNGNPNLTYEGHLNIVNGVLVGPQTQTHKGSFTWARTGGSGSCDVDLTSSFDPATHTGTVTGHFCGHIVNVTQTRGGCCRSLAEEKRDAMVGLLFTSLSAPAGTRRKVHERRIHGYSGSLGGGPASNTRAGDFLFTAARDASVRQSEPF